MITEASFVKAHIARWEKVEAWLRKNKHPGPDRLAELYLQLTDDLAYARTHYPRGEITQYLNNLTARVHTQIYRNKRESGNRFWHFWRDEWPALAYRYRRLMGISALIFGLSIILGALSAHHDDNFVRLILGDQYVNMTEANIESGDPMAVYKRGTRLNSFLGITYNNIRVSFLAYAAGILAGVGTGFILFYNGVMVGAFQYFFYQKGVLLASVLVIWIHGALEIPAIVLAGTGGLILGHSLVFPGTYSRMTSLKRGARDGIKLSAGLVPIIIWAGFMEGFVTPHTELPDGVKLGIIILYSAFVIYYFVIYPYRKYHGQQSPTSD